MTGQLLGTGALVRLALRRDRWLIPAVVLGFAGMAASSAAATVGLYPDEASRRQAALTINATPALVALYGPIYDPSSLGAIASFKLTALGAAMVAIVMVVLVVRHTRGEEEAGRLELVGAGVVGRAAPLTAALILVGGTCVVLGVATTAGLVLAGLPAAGSVAFGAGWAATGLCFAAIAAIAAQVTIGGRAAIGWGLTTVGIAYVVRALGDLADPSPGWESWLSPIGWFQQVRAFSGERWGVLALPLLATAALVPVAYVLRARRDLGTGLLPDRLGPPVGRMSTALGLSWRLQRPTLLAWSVAVALLGGVLGSIAHSISGLLDNPGVASIIEQLGGAQGLTDAFLAAEMGIVGTIVAAYAIVASERLRKEETLGHAEILLATAVTRRRWAASHWGLALGSVVWLLLLAGLAAGGAHALAVSDPSQVGRVTVAALAQVPAAWVLVGLVVVTFGLWPRVTAGVWALYVAFVVVGQFGKLWHVPQVLMDLSPFPHSPILPGPDPQLAGLLGLVLVTVMLVAVGDLGFRRRDVSS